MVNKDKGKIGDKGKTNGRILQTKKGYSSHHQCEQSRGTFAMNCIHRLFYPIEFHSMSLKFILFLLIFEP